MSALAPARHRLRALAETCGLRAAFGGPMPHGRRIDVLIRGGEAATDRDASARWRGRVLIVEQPAALPPARRTDLHGTAARFARAAGLDDCRVELVLAEADDDADAVVGLVEDATPVALQPGVRFEAVVTAGEPAGMAATPVTGMPTRIDIPGGSASIAVGEQVRVPYASGVARLVAYGTDRADAVAALRVALGRTRVVGIATDLFLLRQIAASAAFARGLSSARQLDALPYAPPLIEVLHAGLHTTVQDFPGRHGYWHVGVPPSGPMDDLAWRLANRLVGNDEDAAGIELTLAGPTLRFHAPAIVCLAGPPIAATVDGEPMPMPMWRAVALPAGAVLAIGALALGCRACLAVRHGLDVPAYLGSRSTFDLGGFGGHAGRALARGDWLPLVRPSSADELPRCPAPLPQASRPAYARTWTVGVLEGPHAAPDFFRPDDMSMLYATSWEVHHNSNRTGVRLVGPKPRWARRDGGDAGLHPSNIHDNAYAVGAIDFTGDMPILLGPDGPSLGGFVCPAVVVAAERWKLGQLRAGDKLRFARLDPGQALGLQRAQDLLLERSGGAGRTGNQRAAAVASAAPDAGGAVILRREATALAPSLCLRRSGDRYLLIEYGDAVLDLALRLRVHLLMSALADARVPGVIDVTPGIRSLQIHHDPRVVTLARLIEVVQGLDAGLGSIDDVEVPTRTVHLPLSWDDPATRLAIDRYVRTVRADAPWCPSNIEFIRRINGLDTVERVREIVYAADYLVLGLGDVYLGAPVATPLDPRHRLVTTKYNPARTWTPQNAVGIGGAYLCIYGMEGPGGYQFVGRTVPVWNSWGAWSHEAGAVPADGSQRWLLRCFDRIRFHAVSADRLLELRADLLAGRETLRVEASRFSWRGYRRFLAENAASIETFGQGQRAAFAAERERWERPAPSGAGAAP